MSIIAFEEKKPKMDDSVFAAPGSWMIGDVSIDREANIWTGAVIRRDDDSVNIGARTSVLENCVIEAPTGFPVEIGDDTIISHGAIVHGAKIGYKVLLVIGAIVLEGS